MKPGDSRHIPPGTVHRFRAVTDTLLFEVSTPSSRTSCASRTTTAAKGVKDAL